MSALYFKPSAAVALHVFHMFAEIPDWERLVAIGAFIGGVVLSFLYLKRKELTWLRNR